MFRDLHLGSAPAQLHASVGPANGPPLLFLHGVLRCWRDFLPLFGPFGPRWQPYGLDFRGHGGSAHLSAYRVIDYVEDAGRVLESLERPAVIYGHSLGAMVALAAAARFPQHVDGLVLEDPPFDTMGSNLAKTSFQGLFVGMRDALAAAGNVRELAAALAEITVTSPITQTRTRLGDVRDAASLRFSAHCLLQIDQSVFDPIVAGQWLEGYETREIASRLRCPTLLLQADLEAGGMLTDQQGAEIEAAVQDCVRVKFPGTGHLIHWQDPPRTLTVVGNFLESLR